MAQSQNTFTWADHTIADEQYVVAMPDDAPTDVSAIIGCAVMTGAGAVYHTAGVQRGESVAVFGVGGVGLSAITGAAVVGADPIIAVDLSEEKLDFARRFGATIGVNASEVDPVERIHELTSRPRPVEAQRGAGHAASTTRSTASACARRWSRSCRRCEAA